MWYSKCSWTLVVLVTLFALVTGSCLEYGHSCWGAHGKRSGGKAVIDAKQQPGSNSYAIDTLAEQLYNNNNQNGPDDNDDDSNSNTNANSASNLAVAVPVLSVRRESEDRNRNGLKWTQLMRQHRYQYRQLQDQLQQGRGRGGQYDAAAESWRKLQQALQAQIEAENEMDQVPTYDLTK
ncbi:neuropeptide CCHamide-1 [Drosophila elegans]|uniref:neuropeptide CCHamide-1 n=1 Tax=Drosophila elegans TaxID=30023 RepID=UPI0007E70E5D|nr:neuropeptide CCHamide-1 [Drosophila elegans]